MKTVKLTQTFRLPDELQADALLLLEASRDTVNAIIERLWDRLDEFVDGKYQAWKQVTAMLPPLHNHGSRQCANCGWNGSRDYAAAINIGRLAVPFYKKWRTDKTAKKKPSAKGFRIDDLKYIKPASYIGAGAVSPFLPHSKFVNASETSIGKLGCKMAHLTGWIFSATVSPLLLKQPTCL